MRSRGVAASSAARSYVVSLLTDLAKPGSPVERTLERPLTLLLDEALHTPELGERFDRLRVLGDGVLYSSGFFADHFEARGVDPGYVIGIGRTAYESAGALISAGPRADRGRATRESSRDLASVAAGKHEPHDVFAELSAHFSRFVEVIAEVANATIASGVATSKGLIKLYERWLKTRSDKLADALSSHGFVTPRGAAGARVLS